MSEIPEFSVAELKAVDTRLNNAMFGKVFPISREHHHIIDLHTGEDIRVAKVEQRDMDDEFEAINKLIYRGLAEEEVTFDELIRETGFHYTFAALIYVATSAIVSQPMELGFSKEDAKMLTLTMKTSKKFVDSLFSGRLSAEQVTDPQTVIRVGRYATRLGCNCSQESVLIYKDFWDLCRSADMHGTDVSTWESTAMENWNRIKHLWDPMKRSDVENRRI